MIIREPVLVERKETVRQAIQRELEVGPTSALELSKLVSIREKEVAQHIEHLEKSVKHEGKRLVMEPAACRNCDFVFEERQRKTKPSSCPNCKRSRIDPGRFSIVTL